MQKYKNIKDVKIEQKIILDNTVGIFKELPSINLVGTILKIIDNTHVLVEYEINEKPYSIKIETPYFLLQ